MVIILWSFDWHLPLKSVWFVLDLMVRCTRYNYHDDHLHFGSNHEYVTHGHIKILQKVFFNNYNVLPKKSIPKNMCCFSPPQIGSCCSKLIVKIMLYISKIDYWYIMNWFKNVLNQIFRAYSETRTIKSTIFKIPVYIHNWLKIWKPGQLFLTSIGNKH
jgi:hypothetical protein